MPTQFLGTTCSVVCDVGLKASEIGYHTIKRTTGADALLAGQFLIGHNVLTIQFAPRAFDDDVTKSGFNPSPAVVGEVESSLNAHGSQSSSIPPSYAPYIFDREKLECLDALFVTVDETTVAIARVTLGEM